MMFLMQRNLSRCGKQLRTLVSSSVKSSKDDSSSGENNTNKAKQETIERLNKLLKIMVEEDSSKVKTASQSLELSKPKQKIGKKSEKNKGFGDKMQEAVKNVAENIPGNAKETEAALLEKLLGKSTSSSLSDLISGMKVEQNPDKEKTRAQQVRSSLQRTTSRMTEKHSDLSVSSQLKSEAHNLKTKKTGVHVDVFGAEPSKYFADIKPAMDIPTLETWENCLKREIRLAVTHPPSNIYQQMIIWTDRGIFWKFPIDNEQGLEDEKRVSFEDHIFLEAHLEGWCPEKGPIKQFMDLVCLGLSKNFWMTAEEKKQHIFWFRDFFQEKNALLKEIGAGTILESNSQIEKTFQK